MILKIAPVNNSRIHLVQSEIFVLQKRLYYVLAIVNLICIVLISLPVTKELFSVLKGLTAALALDALTLVIFALKGIYRRIFYGNQHEKSDEKFLKNMIKKTLKTGHQSVRVGCINRIGPNHNLLKTTILQKSDAFPFRH